LTLFWEKFIAWNDRFSRVKHEKKILVYFVFFPFD